MVSRMPTPSGEQAQRAVNTVTGPVSPDSLGVTLMHEHVFLLSPEIQQNYPGGFDEDAECAAAVARLNEVKSRGVDTIVDLTVLGLGRYIPRIQKVAAQVGVNIVVATGYYTYNELPLYFRYRGPSGLMGGPEPLVDMFVTDIEEGIAGTGVRAGMLKCATDEPGLTPDVERVLRAVAQAHRRTGVPISTHTHAASHQGRAQQQVFAEEGVDLSRVVIGHSGDTDDISYLRELADRGSCLGMDRFGLDFFLPFEKRVETVARLCELGYSDRMVLSHDACCFNDWFDMDLVRTVAPNWHYTHISDDVLPALRQAGVSEDQLHQMLVDNPRRILSPGPAY